MQKKTQFSIWYFAIFAVRYIVADAYRRTLELLRVRESAGELLERETLGGGELERIRAAAAPVLPLAQAA